MEKNVLIDKVSAGYEHSLIIYENGNVYCIGFIDILLTINFTEKSCRISVYTHAKEM